MITRRSLGPGVQVAFTDRHGGVSDPPFAELNLGERIGDDPHAVATNRARVAEALDLEPTDLAWMRQEHGNAVARRWHPAHPANPATSTSPPCADAMVSTARGLALAVLVADCLPVLLAEPAARVIGVAHAGWRGLVRGVVPELIAAAAGMGAEPGRMLAVLGPAICGSCYEVPARVRTEVAHAVPAAWCHTRDRAPGLDIPAGAEEQLHRASVARVHRSSWCTRESPCLYSHRRDGQTGRFAGFVWLAR